MKNRHNNIIAPLLMVLVLCGCNSSPKNQPAGNEAQNDITVKHNAPQLSKIALSIIQNLGLNSTYAYLFNVPTPDKTPSSENFETVIVPPPPGLSDGFTHKMILDHKNKWYWTIRSGGIAGVFEKTGPMKF